MAKPRFASKKLIDLMSRLKRIQQNNEMTLEDADILLVAAIVLNWQFIKHEGAKKSHHEIKGHIWNRICDITDQIA